MVDDEEGVAGHNPKGKFKCQSCALSFMSKKLYEKHRKTSYHKEQEKRIRDRKTAETQERDQIVSKINEIGSNGIPREMVASVLASGIKLAGNCSECGLDFVTRSDMALHQKSVH